MGHEGRQAEGREGAWGMLLRGGREEPLVWLWGHRGYQKLTSLLLVKGGEGEGGEGEGLRGFH